MRSCVVRLVWLAFAVGCSVTGGPTIGYSLGPHEHWFVGGEAGLGYTVGQFLGGYESGRGVGYAHFDLYTDPIDFRGNRIQSQRVWAPVGRVGLGGMAGNDATDAVFLIGGGPSLSFEPMCPADATLLTASFELRYVGEWQLVFAPKYEYHLQSCMPLL